MTDVAREKQAARLDARSRRDAMPDMLREHKSALLCEQLDYILDRLLTDTRSGSHPAPTIAVYAAMGSEADPAAFARRAGQRGCTVAYPCMFTKEEAAACGQRMGMRAVTQQDLDAAPFIAHPARAFSADAIDRLRFPIVPAFAIDLVVVPLVAFDARNRRLGYGGGCYDRYLPALRPDCQIIGIAFEEQRIASVPADERDMTLPRILRA